MDDGFIDPLGESDGIDEGLIDPLGESDGMDDGLIDPLGVSDGIEEELIDPDVLELAEGAADDEGPELGAAEGLILPLGLELGSNDGSMLPDGLELGDDELGAVDGIELGLIDPVGPRLSCRLGEEGPWLGRKVGCEVDGNAVGSTLGPADGLNVGISVVGIEVEGSAFDRLVDSVGQGLGDVDG
jgi:hypothetical protein